MSITLPPIGAKIRTTTLHDGGARVVIEGIVTAHPKPPVADDQWVIVGDGEGVTAYTEDWPGAKVKVEILSAPEPESGTWVHVRNSDGGGFGHVFCRDDVRRTEQKCGEADEYRWWWYGNGSWENWEYVQGLGDVEVLTVVAR